MKENPDFLASLSPSARRGRELYQVSGCARCHGNDGTSQTSKAFLMSPRPTNLRNSADYRYGSRVSDMMKVILEGTPGAAMPGYPHLAERERRELAEFLVAWQNQPAD